MFRIHEVPEGTREGWTGCIGGHWEQEGLHSAPLRPTYRNGKGLGQRNTDTNYRVFEDNRR